MGKANVLGTGSDIQPESRIPKNMSSLVPPTRLRERRRSSVVSIDVALSKNFKEDEVKVKVVDEGKIRLEAWKAGRKDQKETHDLVIGRIFDKVRSEDIEVSMKQSSTESTPRTAEINMYIDDE